MSVHDTQNDQERDASIGAAVDAVRDGRLIVLPTDTVYGIGADAFDPAAVEALLAAKGRGRSVPPPVLVGDPAVLLALAVDVPDYAERLAEELWPGPLTLILTAQPSLSWDLGETGGTVALRMPDDATALELLRRTGPLAVSSANRHGRPAALTVLEAATQLGDAVEVYLDGGRARIGTSSTIIDTTVEPPEIVREGALSREDIIAAVGDIFIAAGPEEDAAGPDAALGSDETPGPAEDDALTGTDEGSAVETGDADALTGRPATAATGPAADGAEPPADAATPPADTAEPAPSGLALPSESDRGPDAEDRSHAG